MSGTIPLLAALVAAAGAQVSGAQVSGAQVSGAQAPGAQVSDAQASGTQVSGTHASSAPLAGEELVPRQVRGATAATTRGFAALQQGDLALASQRFEEALSHVPNFPDARVGLGHVAYARRQYEAALDHYTRARDETVRLHRAARDAEQRSYDQAQPRLLKYQDDIRTLQSLPGADVQTQVRELERAIEEMKRIHPPPRRDPDPPPAPLFYHRGNALFQLGRLDDAVADWQVCARIDPKFAAVHNNLALAFWKAGRLDAARAELAEARRLGAVIDPEFERRVAAAAAGEAGPPPATGREGG